MKEPSWPTCHATIMPSKAPSRFENNRFFRESCKINSKIVFRLCLLTKKKTSCKICEILCCCLIIYVWTKPLQDHWMNHTSLISMKCVITKPMNYIIRHFFILPKTNPINIKSMFDEFEDILAFRCFLFPNKKQIYITLRCLMSVP